MADPRHERLADVLVHYSLGIGPGDKVVIGASPVAAPLVRAVYRAALKAGAAHVDTRVTLDGLQELFLKEASDEQLGTLPESSVRDMEYYDVRLNILSDENTKALSGADPARLATATRTRGPLTESFMRRSASGELRWCVTLYPTQAYAQDAGMSLAEYEGFVFGAGLLDAADPVAEWRRVRDGQQRVVEFLGSKDEIRIEAPGTELTYRAGGRTWINAGGEHNFPDGEVFTGPIEDSAEGHVRFTYPAVYAGNEVEGVRLRFEGGRVAEATAERGEPFLVSMLDQDEGARRLGEVAFGLNYGIERFTRNVLFDEKIGGTMHMALGASYPDTGGVNESALHWDMVCDLREGRVWADGELCYEGGRFVISR